MRRCIHSAGLQLAVAVFAAFPAIRVAVADEFAWSWEGEKPKSAAEQSTAKPNAGSEFSWSWEQSNGKESAQTAEPLPAPKPAPAVEQSLEMVPRPPVVEPQPSQAVSQPSAGETPQAPVQKPGVDPDVFADLLRENQELRKKLEVTASEQQSVSKEKENLLKEVKDLESRVAQSTALIQKMEKQKKPAASEAAEDLDRVVEFDSAVADVQKERSGLADELAKLQARMKQFEQGTLTSSNAPAVVPASEPVAAAVAPPVPAAATATVAPGSDLFRELERKNLELKQRLADESAARLKLEGAEQQAALEEQKKKELEAELAKTQSAEQEHRQKIESLLKKIPALESELTEVKIAKAEKDSVVVEQGRDMDVMRVELQQREHRLAKAERMAALLDKARDEIRKASDLELRDMHYNMASVYAKEGRYEEAEREYLRALEIDPTDPEIHYNLAILYDDHLNNKSRAATHYRKYLKLCPYGEDVDAVKNWLMNIEVGR